MLGVGLTTEQIVEILSAYAAPAQTVQAVETTPGWHVLGAFPMPVTAEVLLSAVGSVSDATLTLRLRLFCITPDNVGEVTGSRATISSTTDVKQTSGSFELTGGRLYQIQAEVTGDAGDGFFGVVQSAALSNT